MKSHDYIKWAVKKWSNPSIKNEVISLIIITSLFVGLRFIIYSNGEINNIYIHGINIPVILAGIMFRSKGGIIGGLTAGFIIAPFSPFAIAFGSLPTLIIWGIRSLFFVLTGMITGISFEVLDFQLDKLEDASLFDSETGLANKYKLMDDIDDLIHSKDDLLQSKKEKSVYLILINIENYSEIIDTIGHRLSADFLQQISKEVQNRVERDITIYNIYSNKFAILITEINQKKTSYFINKLIKILEKPFIFNEIPIYLNTYLGITQISEANHEEKTVLEEAYTALNKAQEKKSKSVFYEPSFEKEKENNLILLGEMETAIENNQFLLYYQPKVNLKTGDITGAEALIRWQHPDRGLIPPNNFIPQTEKTALIDKLTYWVIKKAAEDLLEFRKEKIDLDLAINIVPRNLKTKEFAKNIERILAQYNISPKKIELELTETDMMLELEEGKVILNDLADKGFKVSLDDFGTGYSSLAYLKNLPIDNIKVDRSFVKDILVDSRDREIVNTAVQMGHNLNKKIVAEGVDSREGLNLVKELNCDFAQGYFISKPVPFDIFKDFYKNYQNRK